MSKELEALEPSVILKFVDGLLKRYEGKSDYNIYITKDWLLEIKQVLQRLEDINNAEPSEAMKSLKIIGNCWLFGETDVKKAYSEQYDTIENYVLKAQENEKVLNAIKKHFNIELKEDSLLNGEVWARLVSIQSKEDEGTWDTTATANIVNYKEEFDTLKRYFEKKLKEE